MPRPIRLIPVLLAAAAAAALLPGAASAQGTDLTVSGLQQDTSAPVEVTADSLAVDQAQGTAVFTGNVLIVQGGMRLAAAEVTVTYARAGDGSIDTSTIDRMTATGGVTLATPAEAAESQEAVYSPGPGDLVMTGDVLLTQGGNSVSGQRLTVDLDTGAGRMDGRVRTLLQTEGRQGQAAGSAP